MSELKEVQEIPNNNPLTGSTSSSSTISSNSLLSSSSTQVQQQQQQQQQQLKGSSSGIDIKIHKSSDNIRPEENKHVLKLKSGGELVCYQQKGSYFETVNTPYIITYHDLGLNHTSCFSPFFDHPQMKTILPYLNIIHIEAPGHQYNAETIPTQDYPSLYEMAEDIESVCEYFNIKQFIGIGAGAGGCILTQYATLFPKRTVGLILIGSVIKSFSWLDAIKSWVGFATLPSFSNPNSELEETNPDLFQTLKNEMQLVNSENLCHYVQSFIKRDDIKKEQIHELSCKILLIVGKDSSFTEDIKDVFAHFNPKSSTILQIPDCGILVTAEKPQQIIGPFKLFMQGLGYLLDYYQSIGDSQE
eukprot:gene9158-11224_t